MSKKRRPLPGRDPFERRWHKLKKGDVRIFPETGNRYRILSVSFDGLLVRGQQLDASGDQFVVHGPGESWLRVTEAEAA